MARAEGTGRASQKDTHGTPSPRQSSSLLKAAVAPSGTAAQTLTGNQISDRTAVLMFAESEHASLCETKELESLGVFSPSNLESGLSWKVEASMGQVATVILNVKQKGGMVNEGLKLGWGDARCLQHGLYKKL